MLMQYNNAGNITVPNFKTFPDQFSISSLCMRQDFQSCINLLDHVLSLQSLNQPVSQSLKLQYLCLHWNSTLETTSTECKGKCDQQWEYTTLTQPPMTAEVKEHSQSQGEEFGFWGNQSWGKLHLVQQALLLSSTTNVLLDAVDSSNKNTHIYVFPREENVYRQQTWFKSAKKAIIRLF